MKANILFLTLVKIDSIYQRGIYTDLIRKFNSEGYNVYVVCPIERRFNKNTFVKKEENVHILNVKTLNIQKVNFFEKTVATLSLEHFFSAAIKKHFGEEKFNLILYSTPPITLTNLITKLKSKFSAKTYLLLKDIFPQNAVDIGIFSEKGLIHRYFRRKEMKLYQLSDTIGCMSQKNIDYLLKHNSFLNPEKVELNPNCIDLSSKNIEATSSTFNFNVSDKSVIFLYGGNLGKPQAIDFLIKVLDTNKDRSDCSFLIVGDGTEYKKLSHWVNSNKANNVILSKSIPKTEFESLVSKVDVGMIFLDIKFTIPNFPSRLLSYLEAKIPILLGTDLTTDISDIAVKNNFGLWSRSDDLITFNNHINYLIDNKLERVKMGINGYDYMKNNYLIEYAFNKIISKIDV